jgi:hypothetical protein
MNSRDPTGLRYDEGSADEASKYANENNSTESDGGSDKTEQVAVPDPSKDSKEAVETNKTVDKTPEVQQDLNKQILDVAASDKKDLLNNRICNGSIASLPKEGPCLMASLQGIAESFAGKNMTASQKTESVSDLIKKGAIDKDFTVNNSTAVLRDALDKLGIDSSKLDIAIARPGDKDYSAVKADATDSLRHVGRADGTGSAQHWQQGDKEGSFIWDPISGKDEGGRKNYESETRYVIIK